MPAGASYPPVAGVSFDIYCGVTADVGRAQMQGGAMQPGTNPYLAAAGARGIDSTTWTRAQLVWGSRAILDPDLTIEMSQSMSRAMNPNMGAIAGMAMNMGMNMMPQIPRPDPVDPNDPRLAPIEGVTIETYVRLVATQILYAATITEDQVRAVAEDQLGFPPGRFEAISEQWGTRVMSGPPGNVRYAELICQLLA